LLGKWYRARSPRSTERLRTLSFYLFY
jgi:hypothetical protein